MVEIRILHFFININYYILFYSDFFSLTEGFQGQHNIENSSKLSKSTSPLRGEVSELVCFQYLSYFFQICEVYSSICPLSNNTFSRRTSLRLEYFQPQWTSSFKWWGRILKNSQKPETNSSIIFYSKSHLRSLRRVYPNFLKFRSQFLNHLHILLIVHSLSFIYAVCSWIWSIWVVEHLSGPGSVDSWVFKILRTLCAPQFVWRFSGNSLVRLVRHKRPSIQFFY